ncbi:hypothetical protein VZT92_022593 [Zoarces viviparus]|uniref:Uncharacterized protein n=1 Tax=Zoarces viviparus TaxID=48416 RepID=A0AAW1ECS6_ZOAVI
MRASSAEPKVFPGERRQRSVNFFYVKIQSIDTTQVAGRSRMRSLNWYPSLLLPTGNQSWVVPSVQKGTESVSGGGGAALAEPHVCQR